MRIETASVHPYEAPLARAYVSATARHETRSGFILEIETDDGVTGLGEAAPLSNRTESLDEAQAALLAAATALEAEDLDAEALDEALDELEPLADAPTARFATEEAVLDAQAKVRDRSLAQHLADVHLRGRRPPRSVPVNATIPAMEPGETGEQAQVSARAGFSTIKLKATGEFALDAERVQAARQAVGPDVHLRLDVNGAWPDLETAIERMHELAPLQLQYVEQPLPPDEIDAMADLREASPVPVAADEPVLGVESTKRILKAEAADVLVVKPMVVGGIRRTLAIARMAEDHGVPVVVTSTIDGAIGRAGALHTAASLGERELACGLATGALIEREPAAFDERVEQGAMPVPGAPGHGAWVTEPLEAI